MAYPIIVSLPSPTVVTRHGLSNKSLGTRQVDVSPLFRSCGLKSNVTVELNDSTYDVNPREPKNNWLYPAFKAFQIIAQRRKVNSFASVGTGPAIDGIGAIEIFQPNEVILTDVNPNVIPKADENINNYLSNNHRSVRYGSFTGNLCDPLIQSRLMVDLAYGNLPNIPESGIDFRTMDSSSFAHSSLSTGVPDIYRDHLLSTQYKYLLSAKNCLNPKGEVLVNLGGRVPNELVEGMFMECGYFPKITFSMLKLQTEADIVLDGYSKYETRDIKFDFYLFDEGLRLLSGTGEDLPPKLIKDELNNCGLRINAKDALSLHRRGNRIGHIVNVISGIPS